MTSRERLIGTAMGNVEGLSDFCPFSTTSRPDLGSIQQPIQRVPGAVFPKIKWLVRGNDHSPHLVPESVKNAGAIYPLPVFTAVLNYLPLFIYLSLFLQLTFET
jgi:hypothetical protein